MAICGIASSGGHFIELNYHLKNLGIKDYFLVSSKNPQTESNSNVKYFLKYHSRNPISFFFNLFYSVKIFIKEKPKIVISTGAGLAGIFCLVAKLFGAKIIHIETLNRVTSKSMTGKFMYYLADEFIVLWPEQLKLYGKNAKYLGLPFIFNKLENKLELKKVFLTVGSTSYPFDRAIKYFDNVASKHKDIEFFAQIGTSNYVPNNMTYTKFLNYKDYQKKIEWSELVICPPGAGTIIDTLEKGKGLYFIIRLKKYGEVIDNHQYELANKFKELGIIVNDLENNLDFEKNLINISNNVNEQFYKKLKKCLV